MIEILLVNIGNFQEYILDNIHQLKLFNNHNITIITEKDFFHKYPQNLNLKLIDKDEFDQTKIQNFYNNTSLNKDFRNGFWINCFIRFFYIYLYMNKYNKENIIHLENDVLIYTNLNKIFTHINLNENIFLTMDNINRCIPGLLFIKKYNILEKILQNINNNENDMMWLARSFIENKQYIDNLPIIHKEFKILDYSNKDNVLINFNKNYNNFNAIFDAAAIGQYLGGVDPKNTNKNDTSGFINESCLINYSNFSFKWIKMNGLWKPYLIDNNNFIEIFNLHVHCKNLSSFISSNENIIENNYIQKNIINENHLNIFTKIYENSIWGTNRNEQYNGSSGGGSTIEYNKDYYIPFLKKFIVDNKIKSIIDLGSGDFRCGELIYDDLQDINYTGYDAYNKVIEYNKNKFKDNLKYEFINLDFFNQKQHIKNGDLCILKDVLQHWKLNEIYLFMDYIVDNKKFKYILLCNCCNQKSNNFDNTGRSLPLSCDFLPLKKYNPKKLFNYHTKEVSLIVLD